MNMVKIFMLAGGDDEFGQDFRHPLRDYKERLNVALLEIAFSNSSCKLCINLLLLRSLDHCVANISYNESIIPPFGSTIFTPLYSFVLCDAVIITPTCTLSTALKPLRSSCAG